MILNLLFYWQIDQKIQYLKILQLSTNQYQLLSLDNPFTPPRMKTVTPISVMETENDDLREEMNKDDEESSNEKDESTK